MSTPAPRPTPAQAAFYRGMFEIQASYLHHRLRREPWWGMDYGFGNFTTFKSVCKHVPGVAMDLDDHGWRRLLADCWNSLQTHKAAAEREAWVEFLWDLWGTRWRAAYPVFEAGLLAKRYIGCFRYDFLPDRKAVYLHFHNMVAPASPFDPPGARQEDLRKIVTEIETAGHRPESVHFETWMNSLKPVKALFPESFAKLLKAAEEFPKGYGWWGQFVTKDGGINPKRAELLKKEGRFEFARLNGQCGWAEFREKIMKNEG